MNVAWVEFTLPTQECPKGLACIVVFSGKLHCASQVV